MSVWGIDPSTKAVSVAILTSQAVACHTLPIDPTGKLRGAQRCFEHHWRLDDWIEELVVVTELKGDVELVAVELPAGKHVAPSSLMCLGVLLAVLGNHLDCPVVELTPPMWKKPTVGHGNADKAQVMEWARRARAYQGVLQDEADAIGIACAGALLLDRDARVAA